MGAIQLRKCLILFVSEMEAGKLKHLKINFIFHGQAPQHEKNRLQHRNGYPGHFLPLSPQLSKCKC